MKEQRPSSCSETSPRLRIEAAIGCRATGWNLSSRPPDVSVGDVGAGGLDDGTGRSGSAYLVFLNTANSSGLLAPSATSISGVGLTFTEIGEPGGLTYSSSPGVRRIQAWRSLAGAGAGTGSIATTLAGTSLSVDAVLLEFSGVDTSGTNGSETIVQSASIKG